MQQIPLKIELRADATFNNFIVGDNFILIEQLKKISIKGQDKNIDFIYFYGPPGSGRSHLLQSIVHSHQESLNAYIPLDAPMLAPQMLEGLESFDYILLDNIESVIDDTDWQLAIFNLYNRLKDANKMLCISGAQAPTNLNIKLADLKSRLTAMLIHQIKPLSDENKLFYLRNKSQEKGMLMSDEVAKFLIERQQRDLLSLNQLLERLDLASLQAQRKLTIPFVKKILG